MAAEEEKDNRDRRRRRLWSRRLLLERPLRRERAVLMEFEKRADPGSFYAAYRMSPDSFDVLVLLLEPHLEKENTAFREPIGVPERLGVLVLVAAVAWWRLESHTWNSWLLLLLFTERQWCLFSIHKIITSVGFAILLYKFANIYMYNIFYII